MRLQFVTIGQNLNWPRGRLSLARKKKQRREFMTLALARVKISHNNCAKNSVIQIMALKAGRAKVRIPPVSVTVLGFAFGLTLGLAIVLGFGLG